MDYFNLEESVKVVSNNRIFIILVNKSLGYFTRKLPQCQNLMYFIKIFLQLQQHIS